MCLAVQDTKLVHALKAETVDIVGQRSDVQANARDHVGSNNFRSSCTSIGRLNGERSPLTSGNYDQLRRQRRGSDHKAHFPGSRHQ